MSEKDRPIGEWEMVIGLRLENIDNHWPFEWKKSRKTAPAHIKITV